MTVDFGEPTPIWNVVGIDDNTHNIVLPETQNQRTMFAQGLVLPISTFVDEERETSSDLKLGDIVQFNGEHVEVIGRWEDGFIIPTKNENSEFRIGEIELENDNSDVFGLSLGDVVDYIDLSCGDTYKLIRRLDDF